MYQDQSFSVLLGRGNHCLGLVENGVHDVDEILELCSALRKPVTVCDLESLSEQIAIEIAHALSMNVFFAGGIRVERSKALPPMKALKPAAVALDVLEHPLYGIGMIQERTESVLTVQFEDGVRKIGLAWADQNCAVCHA